MVFWPKNILKTVRNWCEIIHVSLSASKTTCRELGLVKVVFDKTVFLSGNKFTSLSL